jgi:hypothetical protein
MPEVLDHLNARQLDATSRTAKLDSTLASVDQLVEYRGLLELVLKLSQTVERAAG